MDLRVAAYAVIVESGRVLLAHWNVSGRSGWTLPGGGIEAGEPPAEAAVREVLEETGYACAIDELIGVDSIVVPAPARIDPDGRAMHGLRIVYRAHVTGGDLRPEVGGSTDAAQWFPLEAIARLDRVELVDAGLRFAGLDGQR